MNNWKYRLFQFMQGRYGMDGLNRFLMWAALIAVLLSNFPKLRFLHFAGLLMLVLLYFRMMSRNIMARQREYRQYLNLTAGLRSRLAAAQNRRQQGQYYAFYKCKNCGQTVRVPKGKGKIRITCPSCGNNFIKNTH